MIRRQAVMKVVPPHSFLGLHLAAQEPLETPFWYDFWCGMWALSVAAGRDYIVPRPRLPVHCNLYVMIVAESGVTRKSAAVGAVLRVAKQAGILDDDKHLLITNRTTATKLEHDFHCRRLDGIPAHFSFVASELVRVLGTGSATKDLPGLLIDLYDCPDSRVSRGTVIRGAIEYHDVYGTVLAACAPSWLSSSIHRDVLTGGFASRVLYVTGEKRKKRVAWPDPDSATVENGARALWEAHSLAYSTRGCRIHDKALARYQSWYNNLKEPADEFRQAFVSRQDEHVLKIAALLALNNGTCEITLPILNLAIRITDQAREAGAAIFAPHTVQNMTLFRGVERVRAELLRAGANGLMQSDLYVKVRSYITSAEFIATLTVMHELGLVDTFEIQSPKRGRNPRLWRMTSKLTYTSIQEITDAIEED